MAKGSGNIRGRSSDASKPYDVSNSFVKRVASRVTELLPQPSSWFSRWMSPADEGLPNTNDYVGHSLSSTITSRPPATSRADLNLVDNVDHHAPAAKKPRTNRFNSPVNQKFLRNDQYSAEDISPIAVRGGAGEPTAGPSSRDTRPELIASTPAIPAQQMAAKVNGDDCSETSESTSGCSSLVPQAQSSTRSLGGSRYGRSNPSVSNLDALDRRRPSFNTTTFHSPLRASMRARLGSSPFYSGRTMYGGSSQANDYARLVETSQSRQASLVRRVGPTVRPPPSQQSSLPLSSTAKRILDALEQFSTPMIDAKKMPVVGSKRKLESTMIGLPQRYAELNIPSTPDLLRVKRRERLQQSTLEARQAAQSMPSAAPAPVAAEYSIRNEDLDRKKHTGKVKTKEKLESEETVSEVKLPAAVLSVGTLPKIDIAVPPPPATLTVSKLPATAVTATAGTKFVFSQPTSVVSSVVIPVSVPTSTFTFSEPLGVGSSGMQKSRTSTDLVSSIFAKQEEDKKTTTFTRNTDASAHRTSAGTPSSPLGTKHKIGVTEDKTVSTTQKWECSNCKNNNSSGLELCVSCQTNKSSKTINISKNNIKPPVSGFDHLYKKPAGSWECSTCLILNKGEATKCVACESLKPSQEKAVKSDAIGEKKSGSTMQSTSDSKPTGSGFGNMFKKPSGSWSCDVCMINNDADKSKCAACESPKPGAILPKSAEVSTEIKPTGSGFGNLFKKPSGSWACDVCMINNDAAKTKCAACESPKPGATLSKPVDSTTEIKPSGSGFGNMFKKPSGSWACDVCMINNDADKIKCAACETPKPGAIIPKATETSGPKFSFGIPSVVSTSDSKVEATFSFGIPKGDQSSSNKSTGFTLPKSTSTESSQASTPTFSFGIPKTTTISLNAVTSSTSSIPTFQFGSGTTKTVAEESKTPSAESSSSSNIFGNLPKKSTPETNKQAVTEKLAFSIPTLTPVTSVKTNTTPVFGINSDKSSAEAGKAGTPTLFSFGSGKAVGNEVKTPSEASSAQTNQQSIFKFGKQEGLGSGLPSSTTNTLSSSSPSNVFKFGDTKTVSSGSGATSISSVSTQASLMTPKPNNMFSFGSNSEKKTVSFSATANETTSISTPITEKKPTFGGFGAQPQPNTAATFGSTNAFGSKTLETKQPTPFVTQTTTNSFGTTANTSLSTFPSFGQTNAFQAPQQESKPSPVFTFGATAPQKESAPSGGFVFNPVGFPSGQTQTNHNAGQQLFGFGNATAPTPAPASAPAPAFNFEPKTFGSAAPGVSLFNSSSSAPTTVFGAAAQPAPAFGETPVFNFGSQAAQQPQTPANPVFEFGTNQQQSVVPAPAAAPTFMFGATPAAAPANPPAFDPNMKPTFNFTQGAATTVFSAIPTVNSTTPAQPQNRKIRKAVRRTNISSVRN